MHIESVNASLRQANEFLQFVLFLSGRDSKTLNDGLHCRTEKAECIHLRDPKTASRLIRGVRI